MTLDDIAGFYYDIRGLDRNVKIEQVFIHPLDWVALVKEKPAPHQMDAINHVLEVQTLFGVPVQVSPLTPVGYVEFVITAGDGSRARTWRIRKEEA